MECAMPRTLEPLPQPLFSEPVFNEGVLTPDPDVFTTPHGSDGELYQKLGDALKRDAVAFDRARGEPGDVYRLADALGPRGTEMTEALAQAGRIVFHMTGDTGASDVRKYRNELRVTDQLAYDCHTAAADDHPAFFFHLGDVVYPFGESQYYYDQFYEPNRNYPAPIFAIPGNHDSFVIPGTPPAATPLATFSRNFCATAPVITHEAGSLHRTAMTQPGVYFTLDAPFVRIISLFSNALEDPGVISGDGGKWPGVPDFQLEYLEAQLGRIAREKYPYAVLLAVHHPPFSYAPPARTGGVGGMHGGSWEMLRQIDTICQATKVYPHAVISGHAHNYQRYTRKLDFEGAARDVPFVVCGCGGHNVNSLVRAQGGRRAQEPGFGTDVSYLERNPAVKSNGLVLEKYDDRNYGYLRLSADAAQLKIAFHHVEAHSLTQSRFDLVTIDVATHTKVAN
jgi:hypothetical protein